MRMSLLAMAVLGLLGTGVPAIEQAEAGSYRQVQVRQSTHQVTRVQRTVQRPVRGVRYSSPPRGSYLTRGRYWDPRIRWKNDPYCRCLFAVHRGDVWFLDPSSGWGYTVDRYGRVYTVDPRYRAVYYVNNFGSWRGELPFFFGFYTPDDGYYALPRYRSFISYWDSPRYSWYGYYDAYDYWWDTYPRYFRSRSFVTVVNFNFYDVRYINYDRHYRRDVYIDYRGRSYIAPQPATINGVPTGAPSGFARSQDLSLPVATEQIATSVPPPSQAVALIEELPKAPAIETVPAVPVNAAEVIATNTQFETAAPSIQQIDSFVPQTAQPETVVTAFDTPVALEPVVEAQNLAREDVVAPTEVPVDGARGGADVGTVVSDTAVAPQFSEPEFPQAGNVDPSASEGKPSWDEPVQPGGNDAGAVEPSFDASSARQDEPSYSHPEPQYEEPRYEEPSYSQPEPQSESPRYEEPSYSQPEPQYEEPRYEEPSYSQPEPQYEEPRYEEPSYSQPEPQYEEPRYEEPSYSQPEPQYEEPRYEEPSYSQPEPQYEEPRYEEPSYSQPEPQYEEPRYEEPSYSQPEPQYEEPRYEEPSYSQPEPQYEEPRYEAPSAAEDYSSDEEGNRPR